MQIFMSRIKPVYDLYWLPAAYIVLAAVFVSGCVPKEPDLVLRPEPILTYEKPFGPTMTFEELIEQNLSKQYSSPETIFAPDEHPARHGLMVINREKPSLILTRGVRSFSGGPDFLAAGFHDGNIRIWSGFPCPLVTLPQKEPVTKIWWDGQSPYICAAGPDNSKAYIYDLVRCARVADINIEDALEIMAVSPRGNHLSLVDQGGRLWSGKLNGEPTHVATLRFAPLQVSYTPGGGVLMISDKAGWLTMWTVPDYEILEQVFISGGPFSAALFDGPLLLLKGRDNTDVSAWDIPAGRKVEAAPDKGEFSLENEVLYYIMAAEKNIKKMLMSKPELTVGADSGKMILRVVDLDGQKRYYNARTGSEAEKPEEFEESQILDVSESGGFTWAETSYSLADPVLVTDQWALWSRFTPGHGHFLWWTSNPGLGKKEFKGKLPQRLNVRSEIPPDWAMLE